MGLRLSPALAAKCESLAVPKPADHGRRAGGAGPALLPWSIAFTLPLAVVSRANRRDHWSAVARRSAAEREAVVSTIRLIGLHRGAVGCLRLPLRVRMVSLYKGRPMDGDNLAGAFKSVRDALAAWLGVDDGDPAVEWFCSQEKARRAACRVEILGGCE